MSLHRLNNTSEKRNAGYINNGAVFSESDFENRPYTNGMELSEHRPLPPIGPKDVEGSADQHAVKVQSNGNLSSSQVTLDQRKFPRPNPFCVLLVRYPKMSLAITLIGHLMMLLITGILLRVGYNIIPMEFAQLPLQLQNDDDFLRGTAWQERNTDGTIIDRTTSGNGTQEVRSITADVIELFYEQKGGNVFTKENLKLMKKVEDEIYKNPQFRENCLLSSGTECSKPMSVLRYFDGTFAAIDAIFNDTSFSNVIAVIRNANSNPWTKKQFQMFLGKDYKITANEVSSSITRSYMYIGGPLEGYSNVTDRKNEQDEKRDAVIKKDILTICEKYAKNGLGNMDFFYNSLILFSAMITTQAMTDMMLAAASLAFIFIFMIVQTGSLWITGFSLLSILTGFCCANLIYRIVGDYQYFGMFHILAVFIILGIGADDIFVFLDTWKNSAHKKYPTLEHRLSDVYSKAGTAMLFTSLTTAIAFVVSGISPLLAVNSFGVFSCILVIVNYLSVIIYLPAVVLNYHLYWEKWTWPCCRCCKRRSVTDPGTPPSTSRKHPVVRFFAGPYYRFITNKIAKWVVMFTCLAAVAVFGYFASTLKPNEEQIKFLKDDSNFGKAMDRRSNGFAPSTRDRSVKIYIIWGLKNQDRSSCHKTDYRCTGSNVWDDTFDLNQPPSQKALLDFCNKLKTGLTDKQKKDLHIQKDIVTGALEVDCFIEKLNEALVTEQGKTAKYSASTVLTLPTSESKGNKLLQGNSAIYNITGQSEYFYRYFEVMLDYWLYSGYSPAYTKTPHFKLFNKVLGSSEEKGLSLPIKTKADIKYGTRLRYAAIVVNTSLIASTLGYPTGLPVRDKWEEFIKEEIKNMPASLQGGFQATPTGFNVWHWLKIQKTLADSAIVGIIIGICIAYPILIIATGNLLVALYAIITIMCITTSVVGVIPMAGWKLGLLESLNLVLVVGLAVDYVVHLAEGYSRSTATDRLGRVHSMLEEVGISVVSGACTTLGASVFMFFAQILFFTQFGIFMFSTIGFSIAYALLLFTSVLAIMGPSGDLAAIKPWAIALRNKIIGRGKGDVDCDTCVGKGFVSPQQVREPAY